jgi:hypothetical protein
VSGEYQGDERISRKGRCSDAAAFFNEPNARSYYLRVLHHGYAGRKAAGSNLAYPL